MDRLYAMGERVVAAINGSGNPRPGVVTAVLGGAVAGYLWNGEPRYMVRFDRSNCASGPCIVIRAEGTREDLAPRSGTAA